MRTPPAPVRDLRSAGPTRRDRDTRIAFGWGVAEATVFFIIPDVFLSYVAVRRGWRRGLALCVVATGGAMLGGLAAYLWGMLHYDSAVAVFERLPAVDAAMIEAVRGEIANRGVVATLFGPIQGQPYKLYAAASGDTGAGWAALMAITVPARIVRFAITAFAAGWLRERTARWLSERTALGIWAFFWMIVYVAFWS